MNFTIENSKLKLSISAHGAEMKSLLTPDGTEYLWQADPAIWPETAPILFPFVGRLTDGGYRYKGEFFSLPQHGFASSSEFSVVEHRENAITLLLASSGKTKEMYPFDFSFFVTYRLEENCLEVLYRVVNHSRETMPFGLGGHPGFRVPLVLGENFEDYALTFDLPAKPDRVGFTEKVFLSGKDEAYPLSEDRFLPLKHSLFDEDAVILKNMARGVCLRSRKSGRGVFLSYPDFPYLGIWHWPKTKAEYVCLEPWVSLPSRQDIQEEITAKSDLVHLSPGGEYEIAFTVTVF